MELGELRRVWIAEPLRDPVETARDEGGPLRDRESVRDDESVREPVRGREPEPGPLPARA
jgi:hypothetical protein